MQGANILTYGLMGAVIGAGFFSFAYTQDLPDIVGTVAAIVIAGGLFTFLAGYMLLLVELKGKKGVHSQDAGASFTVLARCMVAMATADNVVDDSEVRMVTKIFKTVTGRSLSEEDIRDMATQMQEEGITILDEIKRSKNIIDRDLADKIVKASFYILAADGVVEEDEEQVLEAIRLGLNFPKLRYNGIRKKFFASRQNLKPA